MRICRRFTTPGQVQGWSRYNVCFLRQRQRNFMILPYNPKATRFANRRLPLSVLAIAAVLEGKESYTVVNPYPSTDSMVSLLKEHPVELLAVTVVPGPQTVGAVVTCREIRTRFPNVTIVWEGYFASGYTACKSFVQELRWKNPDGDTEDCIRFIRELDKVAGSRDYWRTIRASPQAGTNVWRSCGGFEFPTTADAWGSERWQRLATQKDPMTPPGAAAYQDNGSIALNC